VSYFNPQQSTPSSLPFDHTRVNEQALLPHLPNNPPFIPPIQWSQALAPYAQLITGSTMAEVQNHVQRNPLRTFFFNMITTNLYNNPQFFDMLSGVAELTDYYRMAERADVPTAIRTAAHTIVSVQCAKAMNKYPAIQQYLSEQQIKGSIEWLEVFQGLCAKVAQYMSGGQNPHGPPRQHGQYGHQNAPPPAGAYMPTGTSNPSNSFYGTGPASNPGGAVVNGTFTGGLTHVIPRRDAAMLPEITEVMSGAPGQPPLIRRSHVTSFGEPQPPAPLPPVEPATQGATKRSYDYIVTDTGCVSTPAHLSTKTPTKTAERPYKMAYDPTEFALFHGTHPDGTVEEHFIPWVHGGADMEYIAHELDNDMRAAIPVNPLAPKIIPDFGLLIEMAPINANLMVVAQAAAESTEEIDIPTINPELCVTVGFYSDLKHALAAGQMALEIECLDRVVQTETEAGAATPITCAEAYYDIVQPFVSNENDVAWFINELQSQTTILDVIEMAQDVDGIQDPKLKVFVSQRLTGEINAALKYKLQVPQTIDDAFEDYQDLMVLLQQLYGDGMIEAWRINERALLVRALNVLRGERLVDYIVREHGDNFVDRLSDKILVFADRVAVTYVDWTGAEMNVAFVGSGAISATSMPNLHAAVTAMFARTNKSDSPFAHHLLHCSDEVVVEFHAGWLGTGFYLMSRMQ
jgi:hypothetical protein